MTSDASWTGKLRVIGDLERPDHWHLTANDSCAFIGEYTARAGYGHSVTNGVISNLKKKPSTKGTPQWRYKEQAIRDIGHVISRNLTPEAKATATFVPIPPSKSPSSPDFDDRMVRVAKEIGDIDLREVLFTRTERVAMHSNDTHRDPKVLRESLGLRRELLQPQPTQVILIDDVLTTGCSFKVCQSLLKEVWPEATFFGLFVARRVIQRASVFEAVSDIDF